MPTIINKEGVRISIFPGDHTPAHVHVAKAEGKAKIEIESLLIIRSEAMSSKQMRQAVELVQENQALLFNEWRRINGEI